SAPPPWPRERRRPPGRGRRGPRPTTPTFRTSARCSPVWPARNDGLAAHASCALLSSAGERLGRLGQAEVLAQRVAVVAVAEDASALQLGHDETDDVLVRTG